MSDHGLELFDSLDSCNKAQRQKTVNVLESDGYSYSGNEFKKDGRSSIVVNDDGSWESSESSGKSYQQLNIFLWKSNKNN